MVQDFATIHSLSLSPLHAEVAGGPRTDPEPHPLPPSLRAGSGRSGHHRHAPGGSDFFGFGWEEGRKASMVAHFLKLTPPPPPPFLYGDVAGPWNLQRGQQRPASILAHLYPNTCAHGFEGLQFRANQQIGRSSLIRGKKTNSALVLFS